MAVVAAHRNLCIPTSLITTGDADPLPSNVVDCGLGAVRSEPAADPVPAFRHGAELRRVVLHDVLTLEDPHGQIVGPLPLAASPGRIARVWGRRTERALDEATEAVGTDCVATRPTDLNLPTVRLVSPLRLMSRRAAALFAGPTPSCAVAAVRYVAWWD